MAEQQVRRPKTMASPRTKERSVRIVTIFLKFCSFLFSELKEHSTMILQGCLGCKAEKVLGNSSTTNQSFGEICFFYEASPITGFLVHAEAASPAEIRRSSSSTSLDGSIERGTSLMASMSHVQTRRCLVGAQRCNTMMRKVVGILAPVPPHPRTRDSAAVSIRIWVMGVRSAFSRPRLTTSTPLGPLRREGGWVRNWAARLLRTH
jgi:hypothetical protein